MAAMLLDRPSVGRPTRQYMLRALAFTKNVVEQAAETDIDFIEACRGIFRTRAVSAKLFASASLFSAGTRQSTAAA